MRKLDRREFLHKMMIGGTLVTFGSCVTSEPAMLEAAEKIDIGSCKNITITCISEVGWKDNQRLFADLGTGAGKQWDASYDMDNAAGVSNLIDVEASDGTHHKILLDAGWNTEYMEERFQQTGVDKMLQNGEIKYLVISHEHLDHFWGLEIVLKYKPDIDILVPSTFGEKAFQLIKGAEFETPDVKNEIEHTGTLIKLSPGGVHKLLPGCASVTFNANCGLGAKGEQSLYFNLEGNGIVNVTGCCHQNILTLSDYAQNHLKGGEKLYGIYGGLHIAPFGRLARSQKEVIQKMGSYGFKKIAANHCTGLPAVKEMVALGYPVVKGTARFGSQSELYVGNGDVVKFA